MELRGHNIKVNDNDLSCHFYAFVLQPKHALIQTWCIRSVGTRALIPARILTENKCVSNTASMAVSALQVSNYVSFSISTRMKIFHIN